MRIKLNSSLFHVTQPCTYWVFDDYLRGLETDEMEYREERANEIVDIPEVGQPDLLTGRTAYTSIRRKDLPAGHPEYACEEECSIDGVKAGKVIAKCWLDTLEEWIGERYGDLSRKNRIKLAYRGMYSPKYYNFEHDASDFTLIIPKSEMNYIIKSCFTDDRSGFEEYLKEAHSSYDGYRSFVSNNIADHEEAWQKFKKPCADIEDRDIDHLLWVCLDYWLFGMVNMSTNRNEIKPTEKYSVMCQRWSKNQGYFEENFWDNVTDMSGNGAFYDCMEYTPIAREEEIAA